MPKTTSDNLLTDGGEIVSLAGRVLLPEKFIICSWPSFVSEAEQTLGPFATGKIRKK